MLDMLVGYCWVYHVLFFFWYVGEMLFGISWYIFGICLYSCWYIFNAFWLFFDLISTLSMQYIELSAGLWLLAAPWLAPA